MLLTVYSQYFYAAFSYLRVEGDVRCTSIGEILCREKEKKKKEKKMRVREEKNQLIEIKIERVIFGRRDTKRAHPGRDIQRKTER